MPNPASPAREAYMFIGGRPVHANQNIDIGKRNAAKTTCVFPNEFACLWKDAYRRMPRGVYAPERLFFPLSSPSTVLLSAGNRIEGWLE
jgi:hypothetical protein